MPKKIYNTIDLFAGCGGLLDGFMQEGSYNTLACVEWERYPCATLANRLSTKWKHKNANQEVIRFDIQRTKELIEGFSDDEYGTGVGLKKIVDGRTVDLIIGGPPCQAYSLAGRIRDEHGMKDDYRNYLFESYINIVKYFNPKLFIFENVVGMLSASPNGTPIVGEISKAFSKAGYAIVDDFKDAIFEVADYGVPQHRKRVIILGVNKQCFPLKGKLCSYKDILRMFYEELMPSCKCGRKTVRDAIADLPKIYPSDKLIKENGKKYSHIPIESDLIIKNHIPRFHSVRDQRIFKLLAEDIESGRNKYISTESLKKLYTKETGRISNIHKYYVLRWNEPSNTIPAHLYKDGMRHIHPDSTQARSITVREAARLQTFADDFEFLGPTMAQYKMVGNAVPSLFAKIVASKIKQILKIVE